MSKYRDPSPSRSHAPQTIEVFCFKVLAEESELLAGVYPPASNTTGVVAQGLERRWLATEPRRGHILGLKSGSEVFRRAAKKT